MITASQIRAARALLGWSQLELVQVARLTPAALSRLESGQTQGRGLTLQRLENALIQAGIEFLEGEGVRFRQQSVSIQQLRGADAVTQMQDDIYITMLRQPNREMYLNGLDERRFLADSANNLTRQRDRLQVARVQQKILLQESDRFFVMPPEVATYRWIAPDLFGRVPNIVYGHKVAILFWGPPLEIIVMESRALAETFAKQFAALWRLAKPVPFTPKEIREICADNAKLRAAPPNKK
jgi:transcriptional regulator with XRE-family HTH domain